MQPLAYIEKDGVTTFLYDPEQLEEFFKIGHTIGGAGHILHTRTHNTHTYLTFGTINSPSKEAMYMTIVDNPLLDGPRMSNDAIITSMQLPLYGEMGEFKLEMFDFSKNPPESIDPSEVS